ncbi:MAG: triose-phosphate isomerase [Chitinispirillales bacterium]|jgi:triosephosphate isomerase|nr:triose-phosphate isomerase [Chitinispirillales bacterium]
MSRKIFIAGNWKMNTTIEEAVELAKGIIEETKNRGDVEVAVCPPYVNLSVVAQIIKGSGIKLGAQDVHWEPSGAYTGKISAAMLKSAGCEYVIIGHSEQRQYFGETDESVNKKVKAAIAGGLKPIICVGELLSERENGFTEVTVEKQVVGAYNGLSKEDALKTVIAYEPVWAIGTGRTATPEQADEMHLFIRNSLVKLYDKDLAQNIVIQYGGSMNPKNAKELLAKENVDGGLIGGASLKPDQFKGVVIPQ